MTLVSTLEEHHRWMSRALEMSQLAENKNEVPVGAVLVHKGQLIYEAHNQTLTNNDPTAHAEMICLQKSAQKLGNHRLINCTLYVTLEPCMMCLGAILQSRVEHIVFGASDKRVGSISHLKLHTVLGLNHTLKITPGIHEQQCAEKLQRFFKARR